MDLTSSGPRGLGIAQYAHEAGWILDAGLFALMLSGPHEDYLSAVKFDGILSSVRRSETYFRKIIERAGLPVVDLGQSYPEFELPRVFPDHRQAGRLAAEHLIDRG
jgi:DNA-binding LacI/PurR family transcriptional regulator